METQTYEKKKNTHPMEVPIQAPQETAVAPSRPFPTAPMDWPVERFTQALGRRENNRRALLNWIAQNLKQGTDFGRIHVVGKDKCPLAREGRAHQCENPRHWSKPSLWKPGAEKICGMLGLIPRFPNLREYETAAINGTDIKVILLKCELHTNSGFVAAEGTGARSLAQDSGDINKALKMAEKSAHIDATLRVAGLSEIFTQDIEDMAMDPERRPNIQPENGSAEQRLPQQQNQTRPASQTGTNNGNGGNRITGRQYKFVMDLAGTIGMSRADLNRHCLEAYGSAVDYITRADASSLIDWLKRK